MRACGRDRKPSEPMTHRRPRGARPATEEGNPSHSLPRFAVREAGGTFAPGESTHVALSHRLTRPRRNRRRTRGAASQAASRGAVAFGVPLRADLYRSGTATMVRTWLAAAFPRKREGYRMPDASKGTVGKRGPTRRCGRKRPPTGAGEDRTLEVVLACRLVVRSCRSRQTVAGAEKRTPLHFTRSGAVRGRAPSSPPRRTKVRSGGRRDTGIPHRSGNSHVTASREEGATRAGRGELSMEGTLDRVAGGSSPTAGMSRSRLTRRNRAPREAG